jgi:hypothetical protein
VRLRLLIGAIGVAMGLFGVLRFVQQRHSAIVDGGLWLAGGVVAHDALFAPLTVVLLALGARLVPRAARGRVVVALVVIVTVTVSAIPVLGGWGRRADNPTLLDRHYVAGWCVLVGLVVLASAAAPVWRRLVVRNRGRED